MYSSQIELPLTVPPTPLINGMATGVTRPGLTLMSTHDSIEDKKKHFRPYTYLNKSTPQERIYLQIHGMRLKKPEKINNSSSWKIFTSPQYNKP